MQEYLDTLNALTTKAFTLQASDILIKADCATTLRIHGEITFTDFTPTTAWVHQVCEYLAKTGMENMPQEVDTAFTSADGHRFRVHIYTQRSERAIALRHIKNQIPTPESLMLPEVVTNLHTLRQGLVLIAGAAGTGKSTTLAALLHRINTTSATHIVTLEDPIEYNLPNSRSNIDQREIGMDTASFAQGVKYALRQDPDILMIGELRDAPSAEGAVQAALTGHMVLTSVHADNATQALSRLINLCKPDEEQRIRQHLADTLQASICQKLVFSSSLNRQVPIFEILLTNGSLKRALQNGKMTLLRDILEIGGRDGMMTFNQHLRLLIKEKTLTYKEAASHSPNVPELDRLMSGIMGSENNRILRRVQ
jgi:twitching motility protein PilT